MVGRRAMATLALPRMSSLGHRLLDGSMALGADCRTDWAGRRTGAKGRNEEERQPWEQNPHLLG